MVSLSVFWGNSVSPLVRGSSTVVISIHCTATTEFSAYVLVFRLFKNVHVSPWLQNHSHWQQTWSWCLDQSGVPATRGWNAAQDNRCAGQRRWYEGRNALRILLISTMSRSGCRPLGGAAHWRRETWMGIICKDVAPPPLTWLIVPVHFSRIVIGILNQYVSVFLTAESTSVADDWCSDFTPFWTSLLILDRSSLIG